jgi:hypothetical protein
MTGCVELLDVRKLTLELMQLERRAGRSARRFCECRLWGAELGHGACAQREDGQISRDVRSRSQSGGFFLTERSFYMALNSVSMRGSLDAYLQVFANRADISTDTLSFHNSMIVKVVGAVEQVGTKEQAILADRTKSDEGKGSALAALATASASSFAFLERVVSRVEGERETAKLTLDRVTPPPGLDKEDAREIRDTYRGLAQPERDTVCLQAAEASIDQEDLDAQARATAVLWSLLNAPGYTLITPDVQRRALEERGQQLHPATFAQFQQADMLYDSLAGLRDTLVGWLRGFGGNQQAIFDAMGGPLPDPTANYTLVHQG